MISKRTIGNMKNLLCLLTICLFTIQCGGGLAESPTFNGASGGVFPVLTSESDKELDISMLESASYEYCIAFVDMLDGSSASLYEIEAAFVDLSPENGDLSKESLNIKTLDRDQFAKNISGIFSVCPSISLTELLSTFNLSQDDISENDMFEIKTYITNEDGARFGSQNSMAITSGVGFDVHFDISLTIIKS